MLLVKCFDGKKSTGYTRAPALEKRWLVRRDLQWMVESEFERSAFLEAQISIAQYSG
jgi:hypothetical protein